MRAVIVTEYGGPEVLVVRDVPEPVPGPGRILIKLHTAGVNPVDSYLRSGAQGYSPTLPFTPGMDGAGTIEDVGDGVIGYAGGDRVYVAGSVTGTYAEYCLCSPGQVFPLHEKLDWAEGACLGVPYFTAARALFTRGGASPGESVLVHGASGGVGLACLQLAAPRGITVYGTAGSGEGEALVRKNGAAECFSHRDSGRFEAVREATGGPGVNLIVEMLADVNLDDDLKILAPGGRVVVVGSRGRIEISPRDLMSSESVVMGVRMPMATLEERREYARYIDEGVLSGSVRPPVAAGYSLEEAGEAHRKVMKGPHSGNVVLEINE